MPTISRLLPSLAIPSYRISQKPTHITFSFIHELDLFSFLIPISFLASCCSKLANEADGIFCFFFNNKKPPMVDFCDRISPVGHTEYSICVFNIIFTDVCLFSSLGMTNAWRYTSTTITVQMIVVCSLPFSL